MTTLFDMTGQRVLVSGGATGLGFAMAQALSRVGAEVILLARREALLEQAVSQLRAEGAEARYVVADVTVPAEREQALAIIRETGPLHALINNAGVADDAMLMDVSEAGWSRVLDLNLKAATFLAQSVAQEMAANGGGSIVNIASVLGSVTQKGTGPYAVSKAGLLHLTRAMAVEWGRYQIRVNAIAPGYFRTDISDGFLDSEAGLDMVRRAPIRRTGEPQELSGAVLLLASKAGAYMTGSVITVDGGLSVPRI